MIANNLRKVYTNFDPLSPLTLDKSEFYVERKKGSFDRMKWALTSDNQIPPKFLFSGHRGSGKSTELSKLMADQEIRDKYFIVHYSVRDILDIIGLDYTDLLVSIGAKILAEATVQKIKLKKGVLDELNNWGKPIEEQIITDEGVEIGTEIGLNVFFAKTLSKLKSGKDTRTLIRKNIEPRLEELIEIINNLVITEVEKETGKKVLVAIDDLDKPDLSVARQLFYERQSSLTLPRCTLIYTAPIALLYSPDGNQVKQGFTDSFFLPNVTITKHDDERSPDNEGRSVMKEFVLKRMSLNLIDEDALEYSISVSGGVFREMARIIGIAAANAFSRGEDKIQKQDVEAAEAEIRNDFRRILEPEDYIALNKIYETRDLKELEKRSNDPKDLEKPSKLLHNLSVLEYQNKENWCDVHPAVVPLIKEEKN